LAQKPDVLRDVLLVRPPQSGLAVRRLLGDRKVWGLSCDLYLGKDGWMMFQKLTLCAAVAALSLTACGDGRNSQAQNAANGSSGVSGTNTTSDGQNRSFDINNFTAVNLLSSDDVRLNQGPQFSIRAQGAVSDLDSLELILKDGALQIGRKKDAPANGKKVRLDITLPTLTAVTVTGSGDVDSGALTAEALTLSVTGSGDLKIASLTGKTAKFAVTGSGELEVKGGQIDSGEYSVTGSGDLDANGLAARQLTISVAGSGDVDALASGTAAIQILGSGDVKVKGGAQCTTKKVGSGKATCV
jgi:hypothetical protein